MLTIGKVVEQLIKQSPFLEEALADGLINVSSLSRKLKPAIEEKLQKEVKDGAIIMAINRMEPSYYHKINIGLKNFVRNLGDIIVRSNLIDYTFKNSQNLVDKQKDLLESIAQSSNSFYTFSKGVYETTIVISAHLGGQLEKIFQGEQLVNKQEHLSSITIKLPQQNTEVSGLYYYIFKKLAWEGINIIEVISTTNEFTVVIEDEWIDKAFSILKNLRGIQ